MAKSGEFFEADSPRTDSRKCFSGRCKKQLFRLSAIFEITSSFRYFHTPQQFFHIKYSLLM